MNQSSVTPAPVSSGVERPQGGSSTMKWLLIILVVIVVLGGGYWLYAKYGKTSATTSTASPSPVAVLSISPSAAVSPSASSSVPADWKTYTNSTSGFSFKYPSEWTIAGEKDLALDAQATVRFSVGIEYIMQISYFQTVSKMLGVSGAASVSDYISKKTGTYKVDTATTSKAGSLEVTKVKLVPGDGVLGDEVIFISDGKSVGYFTFNKSNSKYTYSAALENQILSTFQFTP